MDPVALSELLVSTLSKQCADETSAIGKVFADRGVALVERSLPKAEGERLNVSFYQTPEQKALLERNFPGRVIHFTNKDSSSHSFAAAHRLLETDYIYRCFGTTEEPIIDLGGNFVSHMKQRRYNVHSCCPLLDDRDGARFTERLISLKTYLRSHKEELHSADYCEHRFEECDRKAEYVMAIHATSDLPITELCKALANKGTKKMIFSIMIDPSMLIRDSGIIPNFDVRWEIDHAADLVTFDFIGAPCLGYQHKFSVLKQYLTTNAVVVGDKQAFRVERKSDFGGVMIIDITAVAGYKPGMVVGGSRSCAWSNLVQGKTVVHTVEGVEDWWYDITKRSKVLVDTKVLTRVLEASFRQYKPTTSPESMIQNIATMLSSSTNYTVINGVTLQAGESLHFDDYVSIATTIYVRTKKMFDSLPQNIDKLQEQRIVRVRDHTNGQVYGKLGSFIGDVLLPNTVEQRVSDPRGKGREIAYDLQSKSWSEETRNFLYSCLGRQGAPQTLINDPDLFLPLSVVLSTNWEGAATLSVSDVYDQVVKPQYDRIEDEIKQRREDAEKNDGFQRNLLTIAKWIENHPTGEMPKGLGKIAALVPDLVDIREQVVEKPSDLVVNKYASEIQEAITYFETEMDISTRKLQSVGEHCEWKKQKLMTIWSSDESRRIYDPSTNSWFGPPSPHRVQPTARYERGLTKDGFVPILWKTVGEVGSFRKTTKFEDANYFEVDENCRRNLMRYPCVFFDSSCEFSPGTRLVPVLKEALHMEANFERKLVDGIAGCGKTTKILAEAKMVTEDPDLVLTSNRSSAVELREKLPGSQLIKAQRVRTCDSYLMNGKKIHSKRVIFDECFLQHAGCVYAAATLAKADELIMFGDTSQIPFVSRIPNMRLVNHKVGCDEKRDHNLTYRCPIDTTMALSKWFYRKNIKTANRVMRSMSIKPISSVNQIDVSHDLFLTHTQADKCTLLATGKFPRDRVFTSAEAQGKTEGNVAFVRLNRTSINLYTGKDPLMGPCHSLVAMSRHTKRFTYYTTAETDSDDLMVKAIRDVSSANDERVISYLHTDYKL
ncbi:unnamed protein product [Apple necrotic mosaic virus]|uniref:Replication protein 1a n=1 Tax=Apple necrotic mosaic virus TaxID=1779339 RepID=A0A1L7MZX2_9BROM|nr:unnamed protein product [Apple necrotic mosaic virus]BAW18764.1 unnamed protein product [Apple necrotic mosaic virus]